MINATVSHEMRNPLNSINSQNIENKALYEALDLKIQESNVNVESIRNIIKKLMVGYSRQRSSTDLMKHIV